MPNREDFRWVKNNGIQTLTQCWLIPVMTEDFEEVKILEDYLEEKALGSVKFEILVVKELKNTWSPDFADDELREYQYYIGEATGGTKEYLGTYSFFDNAEAIDLVERTFGKEDTQIRLKIVSYLRQFLLREFNIKLEPVDPVEIIVSKDKCSGNDEYPEDFRSDDIEEDCVYL